MLPLVLIGGAASWALITPINHALTGLAPDNPSVVISLNSSGAYLGQALGAILGGLALTSGAGAREICLIAAAIVAVAVLVELTNARRPALTTPR
ncbi:hypothetical protein AB0J83_24900 [Actinoplanes sp. NPDC049596]|uniref:hypothetical protein n=1 Tax=unclassified Actinoplanes TaxID=2626549 RepID=UPI00342517C3